MVDRYGEAIEYDLHDRFGLDLIDFFRGEHSWRKLGNLVSRLPVSSAFMEARLNDPEIAEAILESDGGEGPPPRPSLADYSPEVAVMSQAVNRLGEVVAAITWLGGGKPPRVTPLPTPLTGVDVARARREDRRHRELVDEVAEAQKRWAAMQESQQAQP